jgi:Ankyrin repeats (3 copies)
LNKFKEIFANYTSEHLLEKRALGNNLAEEAHKAIEEIFAERGEHLPLKPTKVIHVQRQKRVNRSSFEMGGLLVLTLFINGIADQMAHTLVGIIVTVVVIAFALIKWLYERTLTKEDLEQVREQQKIEDDGLSELMVAAAKGDLQRVIELLEFGADIDDVSVSGATALMYAARNNHFKIAQVLINGGADVNLVSHKNSTALSLASKQNHTQMIELLKQHGAS